MAARAPSGQCRSNSKRPSRLLEIVPGKHYEIRGATQPYDGYLVHAAEQAVSVGFREGDKILDTIQATTDMKVTFRVARRVADPALRDKCPLEPGAFTGTLSSDGLTIDGEVKAKKYEILSGQVVTCKTGDNEEISHFTLTRLPASCPANIPDYQIFKITMKGQDSITVQASSEDPLGDKDSVLAVRLETLSASAVTNDEIAWRVKNTKFNLEATYYTPTTAPDGIAKLEFIMLPNGQFAPANQLRIRPELTLPPGTYEVTPSAPTRGVTESLKFTAELKVAGVLINFTTAAGEGAEIISEVIFQDEMKPRASFAIEVVAPELPDSVTTLPVTLSSRSLDGKEYKTTTVELPWKASGLFKDDTGPIAVYPGRIRDITDTVRSVIRVPDEEVSTIVATVEIGGTRTTKTLRVYGSYLSAEKQLIRETLNEYKQTFAQLLEPGYATLTNKQEAAVKEKQRLTDQALRMMDDSRLMEINSVTGHVNDVLANVTIAKEYLSLLKKNTDPPPASPEKVFDFALTPLEGTTIPLSYRSQEERQALDRAQVFYQRKRQENREAVARQQMAELAAAPSKLKASVAAIIASPAYSAYVLVYGSTLDGQDAELIDRVMAGIDVASFVLHTPPRLRVLRRLSQKYAEVRAVLEEAKSLLGRGFQVEKGDYGLVQVKRRLEKAGDALVTKLLKSSLTDEEKARQLTVLERIWDSKIAAKVQLELAGLPAGTMKRDIGALEHLLKRYQATEYLEGEVAKELAQRVEPGRYRKSITLGGSTHVEEEMVEWTIPNSGGKRIDHGQANYAEKWVRVNDYTYEKTPAHLRKGQAYVESIKKMPEFKDFDVHYCEYYWSEKDGRFVDNLAARF